ncbi:MAG: hypothetical protein V1754_13590 [Pseudomonadota bacterium]
MRTENGQANIDFRLPIKVIGGISVLPIPWLSLHADAAFTNWAVSNNPKAELTNTSIVLAQGNTEIDYPVTALPLGLFLRNSVSIHTAIQVHLLSDFLVIRGGWAFYRGATEPLQPSPLALDLDRHQLGFGLTIGNDSVRLGVGVCHSIVIPLAANTVDLKLTNPLDPNVTTSVGRGTYRGQATKVVLEFRIGW